MVSEGVQDLSRVHTLPKQNHEQCIYTLPFRISEYTYLYSVQNTLNPLAELLPNGNSVSKFGALKNPSPERLKTLLDPRTAHITIPFLSFLKCRLYGRSSRVRRVGRR